VELKFYQLEYVGIMLGPLGTCWDQLATLAVPIPSNTAFSDTPIFIPHWLNPSSISYLNQV
jgi:hypothetical protein